MHIFKSACYSSLDTHSHSRGWVFGSLLEGEPVFIGPRFAACGRRPGWLGITQLGSSVSPSSPGYRNPPLPAWGEAAGATIGAEPGRMEVL